MLERQPLTGHRPDTPPLVPGLDDELVARIVQPDDDELGDVRAKEVIPAVRRALRTIDLLRPARDLRATFASPGQGGGSSDPLCSAKRGSRSSSSALTDCHMLPKKSSPSRNSTSVPLIRGVPSRRRFALVSCTCASKKRRASLVS